MNEEQKVTNYIWLVTIVLTVLILALLDAHSINLIEMF